jgi:tripartite-type tricarboxylate transporter receptor subunit TctC
MRFLILQEEANVTSNVSFVCGSARALRNRLAVVRAGAELSRQADQADHRLLGRRADRRHDAPTRRQREQDPRPAGPHREQARRRRHPAGADAADLQPDGYTLAQIPLGVFRIGYTTKINWDPLKDISYVLNVTGYAFGIVVPTDSPLKTWADFVAYAKANPGKLTYGSTGNLTSPHLTTEILAQQAGIELQHVPYKGNAEAMFAILSGQIMAVSDSTGFAPHVESGKLRVLNTWGEKRLDKFPDAPTLKELGYNIVQTSPFGIGAPKGTPPEVIKKLHDAFKQAMEEPSYVAALARYDMLPDYKSSADYTQFARDTVKREKAVIDKLGLAKEK